MRSDRVPRTIEDYLDVVDTRVAKLERRAPSGYVDPTPAQVLYDDMPEAERDLDLES